MRERTRVDIFEERLSSWTGLSLVAWISTRSNRRTRLRRFGFLVMRISRADMKQKCNKKVRESSDYILFNNMCLVSSVLTGSYGVDTKAGIYLVSRVVGVGIYTPRHQIPNP